MSALSLIIYGKPGCSLCVKALEIARILSRAYPLRVTNVNILEDPTLFARYHDRIPVVFMEGEEVAAGQISLASMEEIVKRHLRGMGSANP